MASLGHIAVGMAAARIHRHRQPTWTAAVVSAGAWSGVSILPDAVDLVTASSFGIQYAEEWGHRGATHSLVFSLALGFAIGLAASGFRLPAVRTGLIAGAVLVSHAVLDTLTNGGLGCALFWPFDLTRYFAPWNPIPVAPIGLHYFSPYGLTVALTELVLFAPVWLFAVSRAESAGARQPRRAALLLSVWAGSSWLILSGSPLRDAVVGAVVQEDTTYPTGYSEEKFRAIQPGQAPDEVRTRLGVPFGESWFYPDLPDRCPGVHFEGELVVAPLLRWCDGFGVRPGMSKTEVQRLLGPEMPAEVCWRYSRSPGQRPFRLRMVCLAEEKVTGVAQRWYFGF